MTRTRRSPANPHSIPTDLASDGTPFTVVTTTTHQRKMGESPMDQTETHSSVSIKDFENAQWNIYIQGSDGFQFVDKLTGRPYDPDIRDIFGAGRFKSVPIGPEGKPLEQFVCYHKIKDVTDEAPKRTSKQVSEDWGMGGNEGVEMPAWMRMSMAEAKEEKREARRRAEEASIRESEWKRDQQTKEYDRSEREERDRREGRATEARERKERYDRDQAEKIAKDDRDREMRRHTSEQQNNWMKLGAGLVTAFIESRNVQPQGENLNATLISALVTNRNPQKADTSVLEQIKILTALDGLRGGNKSEDKEDSDFMKMMQMASGVIPAVAAMRGGGQPQQPQPQQLEGQQQPQVGVEEMGHRILTSPEAISSIAMKDPQNIAASLVAAVKGNPALKDAVVSEFQKQGM